MHIAAGTDMLLALDMAVNARLSRRITPEFILSCDVVEQTCLISAFCIYPALDHGSGRPSASRDSLYAVFSAYELLRI